MLKEVLKGAVIASAVATMFAAGAAHARQDKGKTEKSASKSVKCSGINDCKGKGACAGGDNSCKGQNSCKGKGWNEAKSAKDCKTKGGTVVAAEKK